MTSEYMEKLNNILNDYKTKASVLLEEYSKLTSIDSELGKEEISRIKEIKPELKDIKEAITDLENDIKTYQEQEDKITNLENIINQSNDVGAKYLIGKEKSYVTNGVFWLKDGLIVTKNGTLAQPSNYQDFLGVKPVIELNDFKYISGDGTKKNPYIVNNRKRTSLSDLYSGEYIKYNGLLLRVIENNDNGTKVLSEKVKNVKYSTTNCEYETSDLGRFLNNNYIKKLNKNDLVLNKWYTYDYTSSYKDTYNEITNQYIGLLKIGDFFIDQVPNSFIMTEKDDKIYSIDKTRSLKVAELDSILDAYPSFVLKNTLSIKSGNGTKNNPYIVGE